MSESSGNAPLTVTFDASASSDPDGDIVRYVWDFDGTQGFGSTAQHTFTDAGNYVVTLSVTDDDDRTASATSDIDVQASIATASVSGTIRILNSTAIDRDVHDRLTTTQSNDTFAEAQPVPSPVTIGGFANVARAGEVTGNLFDGGDPGDFYQISFNGDETILLTMAEANADLDLRLWDENLYLVDASLGLTQNESVEVTAPGNYFVEVYAVVGASNYVLNIGRGIGSNALYGRPANRLSDPFVPGQFIVATESGSSTPYETFGLRRMSNAEGPMLASMKPEIAIPDWAASLDPAYSFPAGGNASHDARLRYSTLVGIKTLAQRDDVLYAEPNVVMTAHAEPNDTFYGSQWHYPAINLPAAWDLSTGDPEVIVATVDTGVLLDHPDLKEKLIQGYDFVSDPQRALDGDGIDPDPNDPGDREYGNSSSFHGTHIAGTIGAESNNGFGVAGVAWSTSIMPLRALGKDGGTSFDVIQAVRYAAGLNNDSGTVPAAPADIINLSLGTSFSSQSEQETYDTVRQNGIFVVASAGNESNSLPTYPAAYDNVIGVSATTITNEIASYSNFGTYVDIAAPGGANLTDVNGDGLADGVISTIGDDTGALQFSYSHLSGTSMAVPHVAGVIALMRAVHPDLTPAEFESALLAGTLTDDLGAAGRDDQFGHGLINAQKALFAAQEMAGGQGSDPGPILSSTSSTLNFGQFTNTLGITLQNVGTGTVDLQAATASEPWVSIQAPGTADGLGTYQLTVDRSNLPDGVYQATITFESDANDLVAAVLMQVTSLNLTADAGLHYVVLVDADGATVVPAVTVTVDQGEYPFTINNVPHGQYRLFAGTDSDDDSTLCDGGEACGSYPTLESPQVLSINSDTSGLEFASGFRVSLPSALSNSTNSAEPAAQQGQSFRKAE